MQPTVTITRRGEERARAGHPWIYRADVVGARAAGGDVVLVRGARGRRIGCALYSDRSQIALRLLTEDDEPPGREFWRARLEAALRFRDALAIDATAYRLVHGEGDRLPSLVVDRYGDYLVVQALSQGTDRLLPELCELLRELAAPAGILGRNDGRVRALEGLGTSVDTLYGEIPDLVTVREGEVVCEVDLRRGQKTGLFLDQRENREAAARYARGRLLDCFSYNGGFALRLAGRVSEAIAIDISEEAVARIARNAALNGVPHVRGRVANVFDHLRAAERGGERFETIVLDPPAFAKNKASVPRALAGYKEINLRAMKLLAEGGYLVTCSCSYNVDEATFFQVVLDAARDAGAQMALVERRMQGRDHPVLLGVPESHYLKCFILRRVG